MLRGYQNYRGRRSAAIKLLIVVLVLILVTACSFLFIQRYVTYRDDGTLRIDLPEFLQWLVPKEKDSGPMPADGTPTPDGGTQDIPDAQDAQGAQDVNLVIDAPEDLPEETPVAVERHLVQLDILPAESSALAETLAASGANGFVWQVRDNTGAVRYSSSASLKDAAKDDISMETLSGLCGTEGVTAVARFNCFHDSYYAFVNMASAAICQTTGYVWYDNLSYHWLDPAKEQARSYVVSLAVECAQMGFDELLLEEMSYPVSGKLEKINYKGNTMGKTEALVLFLTELKAALEPYDVRVSLLVPEDLLNNGSNANSGQDLAALAPLVDAVYASTGDPTGAQAILDAAAGGTGPDFVPLTAEPQDGQWCIAK